MQHVKTIMTATDAATLLGLTRQTINKRIQAGYFKSVLLLGSRLYVIRTDEVEAVKDGKHDDYELPPGHADL